MYKITHPLTDIYDFDDEMKNALRDLINASDRQLVHIAIYLLCITAGLKISEVMKLKWDDILSLGSENEAEVKNEITIRKYIIPINPSVKFQLAEVYRKLGYPDLNSSISNILPEKDLNYKTIVRGSIYGGKAHFQEYDFLFKNVDYDTFFQVVFGRRVFKVCGYSNEISKKLKQHFEFRLNEELFNFLGYKSKDEIIFKLSDINIADKEGIKYLSGKNTLKVNVGLFQLQDKNFNSKFKNKEDGYSFQKFSAFSNFLIAGNNFYEKPVINSVRILLLMSLYNGIRPSILIKLKWKDIVEINEEEETVEIRKFVTIDRFIIKIGHEIESKLLDHLKFFLERTLKIELFYKNAKKRQFDKKPSLEGYVFVTNTDRQLTQPSLLREIKNALNFWNFQHTNKFKTYSTLIMYGRKVIEIKGDHKQTIQKLKEHYNFRSTKQLFDFLEIDYKTDSFKGKVRKNMFEEILYDY